MQFVIIHTTSLNVIERHEAKDNVDIWEKYRLAHPELECDSIYELVQKFPVLMTNLLACPLQ